MDDQAREIIKRRISGILSMQEPFTGAFQEVRAAAGLSKMLENNEILYYLKPDAEQKLLNEKTLEYYKGISESFGKRGLRFFAMKTFRTYPYADGDIDLVLVDRIRKKEYLQVLESLGYKHVFNRSVLRESKKRFFVKINKSGKTQPPVIHVHFTVSWNGIDFLDAETIWSRLRAAEVMDGKVAVPSIEDELLIMAAHSMHENTYITAGELLHLRNLLGQEEKIDIDYMVASSMKYNWHRSLISYFSYAGACYENFAKSALSVMPPFFMPASGLLPGYAAKVSKDFFALKFFNIPRELITFGLVIWLFRGKKRAKFRRGM